MMNPVEESVTPKVEADQHQMVITNIAVREPKTPQSEGTSQVNWSQRSGCGPSVQSDGIPKKPEDAWPYLMAKVAAIRFEPVGADRFWRIQNDPRLFWGAGATSQYCPSFQARQLDGIRGEVLRMRSYQGVRHMPAGVNSTVYSCTIYSCTAIWVEEPSPATFHEVHCQTEEQEQPRPALAATEDMVTHL